MGRQRSRPLWVWLNSEQSGAAGVGVISVKVQKTYIHLVTFRKEDRDFAPTTRYKDYLISRDVLHWESQAGTTQNSNTGQNYIKIFAGIQGAVFRPLGKTRGGETAPFIFLGPAAELISCEGIGDLDGMAFGIRSAR